MIRFQSTMCTTGGVCTLTRGTTFTGRAEFTAQEAHATLNVQLSGTLLGVNFPLNIGLGYEDACNFLEDGHTCPIPVGQTSIWALQFPVSTDHPAVSGLTIRSKFLIIIIIMIINNNNISFFFLQCLLVKVQEKLFAPPLLELLNKKIKTLFL